MGTTSNKSPDRLLKSGTIIAPTLSSPDWRSLNILESAEIGCFDNHQLDRNLAS
jgi:hypothetical protein